jgi:integrase
MPELVERFRAEHLPRRRPGTRADYESMLELYIRPHFGNVKIDAITHADTEALHRRITAAGHPYRANRVMAVLSKHRRRYLREDELAGLLRALTAYPDQRVTDVIRLLLLTGARRSEVLGMRWADLDLATGVWAKPPSSTKQNKPHEVPLNAPARQILAKIRDEQTGKHHRQLPEYVFPGAGQTGHVVEIKKAWRSICQAAGIANLRIHDLRHSFASEIASAGGSLPLIGALLGHSNVATTARYSHL